MLNTDAAIDRLRAIVQSWKQMIQSYPPEVAEAKTAMVVLRGPDIEAMRLALVALTGATATLENEERDDTSFIMSLSIFAKKHKGNARAEKALLLFLSEACPHYPNADDCELCGGEL